MKHLDKILNEIILFNKFETYDKELIDTFKIKYSKVKKNEKEAFKNKFNFLFSIGYSDRLYLSVEKLLRNEIYLFQNIDVQKVKKESKRTLQEIENYGYYEFEYFEAWFERRCKELEEVFNYLNEDSIVVTTSGFNPLVKINFQSDEYNKDFIRQIKPFFIAGMHTSKIDKLFSGNIKSNNKLGWKGEITLLAVFIQLLFDNGIIEKNNIWKIASECFVWIKNDGTSEELTPKKITNRNRKEDMAKQKLLPLENAVSSLKESIYKITS